MLSSQPRDGPSVSADAVERVFASWYLAFSYNGQHHRFNLNKQAGNPRHYVMAKTEAESLNDLYRSQIRAGTFNETPRLAKGADARLTRARRTCSGPRRANR